jgi:hypothetical protein
MDCYVQDLATTNRIKLAIKLVYEVLDSLGLKSRVVMSNFGLKSGIVL